MAKAKSKKRPVLVTTAHRGVFFGYAPAGYRDAKTIKLRNARNCLYWSSDVKGFMGLASDGPTDNCRIGPATDIILQDVTSVSEVSASAVKKWEAAPWRM